MSRIGKNPVELPKGVTATIAGGKIAVKGPKGQLEKTIHPSITIALEGSKVVCTRGDNLGATRAAHGLMRALIANMAKGVSQGFERKLEINGVGYRAELSGKKLVLQLGFSHPVEFVLPAGIAAAVDKNVIILSSIDKESLGLAAAKVRSFRPPEPYKGKGVKYMEETIVRKAGKAAG